jgi:hypothetical protein
VEIDENNCFHGGTGIWAGLRTKLKTGKIRRAVSALDAEPLTQDLREN